MLRVQAFLNFRSFNFRNFRFNAVYDSIHLSSPLVLLSNLGFCILRVFLRVPALSIAMDADDYFYVKAIATYAPTFFG